MEAGFFGGNAKTSDVKAKTLDQDQGCFLSRILLVWLKTRQTPNFTHFWHSAHNGILGSRPWCDAGRSLDSRGWSQ